MRRTCALGLLVIAILMLGVPTSTARDLPRQAADPAHQHPRTGPKLETAPELLDAALNCDDDFGTRQPVLLVHGTSTNSEESWPWGLGSLLPKAGYDVCTVDLPERALVDIQTSAEYVVHALRTMANSTGRLIDVVGHSQGTLQPRWALRWWPDVRDVVDDLVLLAPPNQGTATAEGACLTGSCAPAIWQMNRDSTFITALNTNDPVPAVVDISVVVSLTDELIQPAPDVAELPGATVVVVQDICPGRYVGHTQLLVDAVSVDVVLDALAEPGTTAAERIDPAVCGQVYGAGIDSVDATAKMATLMVSAVSSLPDGPTTDEEPPLRGYARR